MKTLLVTGPIGGGKSSVCRHMQSRGIPVYDCDSRTKRLYSTVPGLKERIEAALGIRWDEIGSVFSSPEKLSALEGIVYPLVVDDILRWKESCGDSPLAAIESAVALDKPQFDGLYDAVLLVTAPYALRLARNPKAGQRDRLQSHDLSRADYVIENDSSLEELKNKTERLICRLI